MGPGGHRAADEVVAIAGDVDVLGSRDQLCDFVLAGGKREIQVTGAGGRDRGRGLDWARASAPAPRRAITCDRPRRGLRRRWGGGRFSRLSARTSCPCPRGRTR